MSQRPEKLAGLALVARRVGPPAVPDPAVAVAGLERALEGVAGRLEFELRVDMDRPSS